MRCCWLIVLAALSMAHVGSPDAFFTGKAGPYDVRVTVRLPGVIPGRAQVAVRLVGASAAANPQVTLQAAQWNVGLTGAPPPEPAVAVPGSPDLYAAELWLMTASSYQLAVHVTGAAGSGTAIVPVMAIATAERPMPPWLGWALAGLGLFLTVGFMTIIGSAVRESVLPPGVEPDSRRRTRARIGIAVAALAAGLLLWGGNVWWAAEASGYSRNVLYRPFAAEAQTTAPDQPQLTLAIRDPRWTGVPNPASRYNALLPDHGKLMHLFLVREPALDAFAHLHPTPRSPQAMEFDTTLPALPAGRYRVYGDIVHESGYAQTMVSNVEIRDTGGSQPADVDDSWFSGSAVEAGPSTSFDLGDGLQIVWNRGDSALVTGEEVVLAFSVRDATGTPVTVAPYMGMAAHAIVASHDGSVFAHLHPSGSISMAALQMFTATTPTVNHAGHDDSLESAVAIPFAFPRSGTYRIWVQVKRSGKVMTAAFQAEVR
jgi:hypothetical protein